MTAVNTGLTIGKQYRDIVTDATGTLTKVTQYSANYVEGTLEGRSSIGPWSLTCSAARLTEVGAQAPVTGTVTPVPAYSDAPAAPVVPPATPTPAPCSDPVPPATPATAAPASAPVSDELTPDRREAIIREHVVKPGAALMQVHANKTSRVGGVLQQFGVADVRQVGSHLTSAAALTAECQRFMAAVTAALEAA